jgi:hypothetical protein
MNATQHGRLTCPYCGLILEEKQVIIKATLTSLILFVYYNHFCIFADGTLPTKYCIIQ